MTPPVRPDPAPDSRHRPEGPSHPSLRLPRALLLPRALRLPPALLLGFSLLAFGGCAGSNATRGPAADLIANGQYVEAIAQLQAAAVARPDDAAVQRNLGVAYLKSRREGNAFTALEEACRLDPTDEAAHFYAAKAAEAVGEPAKAEGYWARLADLRPKDVEVRTKLREARLARLRHEIFAAQRAEQDRGADASPENSIAVLEFRNLGGDSTLAPLGKGLAAMVSGDLAALGRFTVVEREKLAVLLQEVQLGAAVVDGVPLFDAATTPRAGRLLGAPRLVQGGIQGTAAAGIDLDAGLTETATGAAAGTGADADGPLAELFRLEKELVVELVESLGLTLSPEERNRIGVPPTRNIDAFLAWSRGLGFEDAGNPILARAEFQRALSLDPGFRLAADHLAAVSGSAAGLERAEATVFAPMLAEGAGVGSDDALRDRLDLTGAINGRGLSPARTGDGRGDPELTPAALIGQRGTIIIGGEVPR